MPTKIIREPEHITALVKLLEERKLPLTISWVQGAGRREEQNRLAQRWFTDIARQLGDVTHEDVRAECKVTFGVPIMCAENDAYREAWQRRFGQSTYEEIRADVKVFDLPVTRLMNVKQMTGFMDAMSMHWRRAGIYLTDPAALKYEAEFGPMMGAAA